ncbi:uncharacterized protein [Rutidosis leptorrhynchoides]|uniref:uncharacterized protein n=1 Tax=Rutidosis leptorrhynchoides TaxID=125765 RepID=UPI003A9A25FE
MARKSSQNRNGVERHMPKKRAKGSESGNAGKENEEKVFHEEEIPTGNLPCNTSCTSKSKAHGTKMESARESLRSDSHGVHTTESVENSVPFGVSASESPENVSSRDASGVRERHGRIPRRNRGARQGRSAIHGLLNRFQNSVLTGNFKFLDNVAVMRLRELAAPILKIVGGWLEKYSPMFDSITTRVQKAHDFTKTKFEQVYPVVLTWLMHLVNVILLLSMIWLDCALRGIDSFLRMGTTSFFSVLWCSIFSVFAMAGLFKCLIILAIAALVVLFLGFTLAVLVIAISGVTLLWFYGSFWTTAFIILLGGLAFMLSHERLALLITTVYSVYCAWGYVGWLGLLFALNLSFISSDALLYFLKNNMSQNPHRGPEQTSGMEGQPGYFNGEQTYSTFENGPGISADRGPGVPSTSGVDGETTSEDEVARLLSCTDHYSALGCSRYGDVDVALLKKEYRKKAMLVHPDKNMGNERAVEAFKKLQNAYEVLLDSLKRKEYDDKLRREELLMYFHQFQNGLRKNGQHGFFSSVFSHPEADGEDPVGGSRRIACKRCGNFHIWILTKKSKLQARWCQECQDFHQAKDGDGWVEQSSQPFLFGMLRKVDAPTAFVCADSKIYNATEWYICQGMRCPVNSHKPSFHVNTAISSSSSSKHNNHPGGGGKGGPGSGQRGRVPPNLEETMTEEEFFGWIQNAMQSGMFENNFPGDHPPSSETPPSSARPNNGSSSKKKKKGRSK